MASNWTARTRFLLIAAAVLLAVNLGRQAYRWFAFADEREDLRRLSLQLDSAALSVMRTQILADSLRRAIEESDVTLRSDRRALSAIERRSDSDRLPVMLYDEYRRALEQYNARVGARNEKYERWRNIVTRNHRAVDSYNALADSIRGVGHRMGEPYIAIPTPSEVAVRHGLDTSATLLPSRPAPTRE